MRKNRRRIRCPRCNGLHTKRHGSFSVNQGPKSRRRWYCYDCRSAFSPWRQQVSDEAVRLYFDTGASYRGIGRTLKVRPMTAYDKVIRMSFNSKSPLAVSLELKPQWCGYLIVDGDSIIVGKHREYLLLGTDSYSQDIPHAILAKHEDGMNWAHFFLVMKYPIRYPLKGIISDGDPAIQEAREAVYPGIPYQLCVRHFEKELLHFLKYRFIQKRGYWRETEKFLEIVHRILYAKTFEEAKRYLSAIFVNPGFNQAGLSKVIETIEEKSSI